jgi:hypothetical protein
VVVNVSDPTNMEPGYTLINCFSRGPGGVGARYTIIVDSAGEVVWYSTKCMSPAHQLPNGNFYYRNNVQARELNMLGYEVATDPITGLLGVELAIPGSGLHHDLLRTPHGTYLSLDRRLVDVADFPTSETDPNAPTETATLNDDLVVEFLPDGTLRREWPLVDLIDVTRIGYDSLVGDNNDWTHANAVNYDLDDDSIIVSVRHQDAVIKFSRETGNLEWILGPHDNWSPEFNEFLFQPLGNPFRWQFHQHAPMWTGSGTIMLFDNGNHKASPFDGTTPTPADQSFSRGVEFEINEQAMTVRQVWEYGENIAEQLYSSFISDADWQETTGNRLMTFGAVSYVGGVLGSDLGLGDNHTRIIEVTDSNVPVFDLRLSDAAGVSRMTVYRSERIPSLYALTSPPGQLPWIVASFKPPNGVGDTLRMAKNSGLPDLSWTVSPSDSGHDPADYYMVHVSSSPAGGFTMLDSTMNTNVDPGNGSAPLLFYKVVAGNVTGTSGDEPAP